MSEINNKDENIAAVKSKTILGSRLQKTPSISFKDIKKKWVLIDASGVVLGRLASYVAMILKGKNKPFYTPHIDCGDNVILINCDKILMTGSKLDTKNYYRHSGYPGGLKTTKAKDMLSKDSSELVRLAVKGMLGRGPMARHRLTNLMTYRGSEHNQTAQCPAEIPFIEFSSKNNNFNTTN
jgi:large subunit ribosomal protein L13